MKITCVFLGLEGVGQIGFTYCVLTAVWLRTLLSIDCVGDASKLLIKRLLRSKNRRLSLSVEVPEYPWFYKVLKKKKKKKWKI